MGATRNAVIIPRCYQNEGVKLCHWVTNHPPSGAILPPPAVVLWPVFTGCWLYLLANLLFSPKQLIDFLHMPWCQGAKLHGTSIFLHLYNRAETWDGQCLFTACP